LQHLHYLARFVVIGRETQDDQVWTPLTNRDIGRRVALEEVDAEAVGAQEWLDAEERFRTRTDDQGSRHCAAGDLLENGCHKSSPVATYLQETRHTKSVDSRQK
jgi:hypothetical protein